MIGRHGLLLWFYLGACICQRTAIALEQAIVNTEAIFDVKQDGALLLSVDKYLSRFTNLSATKDNLLAAEAFLNAAYFSSTATCKFVEDVLGQKLLCHIQAKRIIGRIFINNLPASLLEGELKRKLPVQVGQSIDIDAKKDEILSTVRSRVETFLRKNGFYGATLSVSINARENSPVVDIIVQINDGIFARVNEVTVFGDPPMSRRAIAKMFRRMCFRFDKITESISLGTLSCYSRELERETLQGLQDRFAKKGFVQARIRIGHHWIDPNDVTAPKDCQKRSKDDITPHCINLRLDIDKGPKVTWAINVKDRLAINRNALLRFIGAVFAVDQFSRATVSAESDETASDYMIVNEELLKEITFISSKNVDELEISESANEIKRFLVSRGYANAEVVTSFSQEDPSNIVVNFDVYAGPPYSVRSVRLAPDKYLEFVSEDDLEALVGVRSMTNDGHLSYEEIEAARAEIESRLNARGFQNLMVKTDLESLDIGGVSVVFYVTAGERETVDEVIIFNGHNDLNESVVPLFNNCDNYSRPHRHERLRKLCHKSSLVRNKLEEDAHRLADYYQTNGYLYAAVKSEIIDSENGYKIMFTIYDSRYGESSRDPLKRQEIKDILIVGNESTYASVIKRLFPRERKSSILDPIALKKGLSNVRETAAFSRIDHKILFGAKDSEDAYFLLQLAERPSRSIDIGIAFSTDQFFSLEAEFEETNLFSSLLKLNTSLALGLFWGRQSSFSNKFVWPFILGLPLKFTMQAPMIVYDDRTHWPKEPSRRLRSKVSFALEWRATSRVTPYLRYWLQLTQTDSGPHLSPTFQERITTLDGLIPTIKKPGSVRGVLKPGISYINLDNPFDPHSGVDMNWWAEFSGGPFLGNPPFVNVGTQNRFFIPLGPLTLALQTTFMRAFIEPNKENWEQLKNSSEAMDSLGGDHSVRGYYPGDIGIYSLDNTHGIYAGYFANTANIELRFPITTKSNFGNFSGALFVDQGMLLPCSALFQCPASRLITDKGFGLSVGPALRYTLPVGPISLDYGISPITGNSRLHILFGFSF